MRLSSQIKALVLALAIWVGATGFAFGSLIFDRTVSWKEEVLMSDGATVWVSRSVEIGPDAFFRPGRGGILRSSLRAKLQNIGEVVFDWEGYEVPVSFDVVAGVPWVVIPIAGYKRCEKYSFPKESVAAFYLKGHDWISTPFENAPVTLRQNILRSTPTYRPNAVSLQSAEKKRGKGHMSVGLPLTDGFIPDHIRWEHSCPRISPRVDPEREKLSKQYLNISRKSLDVRIISTHTDTINITRREDYLGKLAKERLEDEVLVVGCAGRIGRVESIRPWVTLPDGSKHSSSVAFRIDLAGTSPQRSTWLPMSGSVLTQIRCTALQQYAILIDWNPSPPHLTIASFGLEGEWKEIWQLNFPRAEFHSRGVLDFVETPRGFQVTAGEINYNNSWHAGEPLATIGRRYVLEAVKP